MKIRDYKNQLNLKKGGLVHIINGARIFAINNRITETSTLGRLRQLTEMGVISEKKYNVLKTAFEHTCDVQTQSQFKENEPGAVEAAIRLGKDIAAKLKSKRG